MRIFFIIGGIFAATALYVAAHLSRLPIFWKMRRAYRAAIAAVIAGVFIWKFQISAGIVLYLAIFCAIADAIRLIFRRRISELWPVVLTGIVCVYGYYNARYIAITRYEIRDARLAPLRIALATDLHLGTAIKEKELSALVERINAEAPDIILLGGDLYDHGTSPELRNFSYEAFKKLRARHGVFYVFGNHEKLNYDDAGRAEILGGLRSGGVIPLVDETYTIGGKLNIIGRKDRTFPDRKPLAEFARDKRLPTIILDHQPMDFEAAEALGAALILSGHTHDGQLWPIGPINELFKINRLGYGVQKTGGLSVVVTSGAGAWGFPMRVGTKAEVAVIEAR